MFGSAKEQEMFLLACRYLYYCKNKHLIPDTEYDMFERRFKEDFSYLEGESPIFEVASDLEESYSDEVKEHARNEYLTALQAMGIEDPEKYWD